MVYLDYVACLRYTILIRNSRNIVNSRWVGSSDIHQHLPLEESFGSAGLRPSATEKLWKVDKRVGAGTVWPGVCLLWLPHQTAGVRGLMLGLVCLVSAVVSLPDSWGKRVGAGTVWPGVCLLWLPRQTAGVTGLVLGLFGLVSVYCGFPARQLG